MVSLTSQEMNYGKRFPSAFVWSQGIADGGTTQLVLTGGKLLGFERYLLRTLWYVAGEVQSLQTCCHMYRESKGSPYRV